MEMIAEPETTKFRFSGDESFVCRYAWLPKALEVARSNPKVFADDDAAMVLLGVGKNMVRSIRFWAEAASIIESRGIDGYFPTRFAELVLGEDGHDPFLEDARTLWLIHWKISTHLEEPLFAWHFILNQHHDAELTRSSLATSCQSLLMKVKNPPSPNTLNRHFDVFIRSYSPSRGSKSAVKEDNLDSPLTELNLIKKVGDRQLSLDSGKREPVFALNRESKPGVTPEVFAYCLDDFFSRMHPNESTLPFREIAIGTYGPGQVFKLPEADIRDILELLNHSARSQFSYQESANLQQVIRTKQTSEAVMLKNVYSRRGISG